LNPHSIFSKAHKIIFHILFHQIIHFSHSNLYSKNFLTNQVSSANAAIHLLISHAGSTQYLSLMSPVVQPESVIAIIAARFFSFSDSLFFNQYKTLKVPLQPPITVIFILLSFTICFRLSLFAL